MNMSDSYEYQTWENLKQRCLNPKNPSYPRYGGKGISLYAKWAGDAEMFIKYVRKHLGPRPEGFSLDRIEGSKGYEPGNLRWADVATQNNNRKNNIYLDVEGERRTIGEWATRSGINRATISSRLQLGWCPIKALSTKPGLPRQQP